MERKNKSPVWKVFIKDAAHKRTICTLCGKEFKYRYTTTNLRDHLKRYHPESLPDNVGGSEQPIATNTSADTRSILVSINDSSCLDASVNDDSEPIRKNKSTVWQVFVKDVDNKTVTCTICYKNFKFWNNTTNLRAHLKRSHPDWCPEIRRRFTDSGDEIESDDADLDDMEGRRSSTSSTGSFVTSNVNVPTEESFVWRVFVKDDNKRVFCTLCQKHFSILNDAFNMVDHLRRLHPAWEPISTQSPKCSDQEVDEELEGKESISDTPLPSNSVFLVHSDRKNRSPVWDVFVKDTERKRTICTLCSKEFKCWNNTANLLDHLRRIHPNWKPGTDVVSIKTEETNSDRKRPTIARLANSTNTLVKSPLHYIQTPFTTANIKSKVIDKLIGEMICLDFQNLSIVEDTGFKKLMKELVPHYTLPTRKSMVKQTLPEIYESVCKYVRMELTKAKYVSISAELWTNMNVEAFVTLTVHYFPNDKYMSSVLQTERIHNDHSSEDLAGVMHKIFDHWGIFEKITAIVADDDEALKAACTMLNITHIPCVAQLLNCIMTEVLTQNDDAQILLQRCQNLVAHFKLNPSANDILHDIQSQMEHSVLNLKQVEPTRWNSALHMFQRLVEMKEPLTTTLVALPQGPEPLNNADWLNLDDFIAVLKPFELMTSELSADSYCNISKVVPLLRGVQVSLQNVSCSTDLGSALKKALLEKLESRFSAYEKHVIPSVATLLDPRFKRAGLGVESTIESTQNYVIEQLSELKISINKAGIENAEKNKAMKPGEPHSDIWNFLDEKVNELSVQKAPANSAEVSVTQYLELPYLKRYDCPFKFWISQMSLEPELADIAMKFMCIPATSFPADRLYSKAGISMSERRNRITTKNFDTLIFLNKNLSRS